MPMEFQDVRIGQVGVEASSVSVDGAPAGHFGGIGWRSGYSGLFEEAAAGGGEAFFPWTPEPPHHNRFWKKYVTGRMARRPDAGKIDVAWRASMPFKADLALPLVQLHDPVRRSYSRAFVWPTGFGYVWNNWIETEVDAAGLVSLLAPLRRGDIAYAEPGGKWAKKNAAGFHHEMLRRVGDAVWGERPDGLRSDPPMTVVTIIRAAGDPADKEVQRERDAVLDGLKTAWGERPAPVAGDLKAESGETVFAAKGLRLVWLPTSFLNPERPRSGACFHNNLLAATLQVEMLAAAAQMLDQARDGDGALPADLQSTAERVRDGILYFTKEKGYSAPFLKQQLERDAVVVARAAIGA
jgi:hypothetical protein